MTHSACRAVNDARLLGTLPVKLFPARFLEGMQAQSVNPGAELKHGLSAQQVRVRERTTH
jgi:hypothetical protein